MLARHIEEATACPDCGKGQWEWDPKYGGHRQAYEVQTWICPVCRIGEAVGSDIQKDKVNGKKMRLAKTRLHPSNNPEL